MKISTKASNRSKPYILFGENMNTNDILELVLAAVAFLIMAVVAIAIKVAIIIAIVWVIWNWIVVPTLPYVTSILGM